MEITVFDGHIEDDFFCRRITDKAIRLMILTNHDMPLAHLFGMTHTFQVFAVGFIAVAFHKLKGFFCGILNFLHALQVVMHLEIAG